MDANNIAAMPDLQAILATLSQFAPPAAERTPTLTGNQLAFATNSALATSYDLSPSIPQPQAAERSQDPRLRPQSRSAAVSPKPMIDPATIVTWQEGLRCVTKIAAQNAQFAVSIRKMMDDQKRHELQWYRDRQALKQAQAGRATASAKAQAILGTFGNGTSATASSTQTDAEKQSELVGFDLKIYAAQLSMEDAMTGELKSLGVPFFGTKADLVMPEHDSAEDNPSDGQAKRNLMITMSELMSLRRRMVEHLEDLYRD